MRKIIVRGRKEDLEEIARELGDRAFIYDDRIELYVQDSETEELVSRIKDKLDLRYKESIIEVYKPEFVISPASRREKAEEKTPVEKLVEMTKSYASLNPGRSVVTAIAASSPSSAHMHVHTVQCTSLRRQSTLCQFM